MILTLFHLELYGLICYHTYMQIIRQQQLLSQIKRIVSTILRELDHEHFHTVVVTSVILSNDGRECRVWVDADEATVHELNTTQRGTLQHAFMKQYVRKIVPKLIFVKDHGEVMAMEELLEKADKDES